MHKYKSAIYYAIILILGLISVSVIFNNNIWRDELFTIRALEADFAKMNDIISSDVHPPLYYYIARIFTSIFGVSVPVLKMVSIIPMILLAIWIARFSEIKSSVFVTIFSIVAIFCAPNMLHVALEMRMYSWTAFFLTICAFYGYRIYANNCRLKDIVVFILMGLGAAYCHYFGLLTAAIIYLYVFVGIIIKDRTNWKKCIYISVYTILGYLPWLIIAFKQVGRVVEDYWIYPILWSDFQNIFMAFLFPQGFTYPIRRIFFWVCIVAILLLLIGIIVYRKKRIVNRILEDKLVIYKDNTSSRQKPILDSNAREINTFQYGIILISFYFSTLLVGMILSIALRPLIIERSLYPTLPIFWIGVSLILSNIFNNKYIRVILVSLLIICGATFYPSEAKNASTELVSDLSEVINDNYGENDIIVTNHFEIDDKILEYYFPKKLIVKTNELDEIELSSYDRIFYLTTRGEEVEGELLITTNFISYMIDLYEIKNNRISLS